MTVLQSHLDQIAVDLAPMWDDWTTFGWSTSMRPVRGLLTAQLSAALGPDLYGVLGRSGAAADEPLHLQAHALALGRGLVREVVLWQVLADSDHLIPIHNDTLKVHGPREYVRAMTRTSWESVLAGRTPTIEEHARIREWAARCSCIRF